jgi:hypothetical protein
MREAFYCTLQNDDNESSENTVLLKKKVKYAGRDSRGGFSF